MSAVAADAVRPGAAGGKGGGLKRLFEPLRRGWRRLTGLFKGVARPHTPFIMQMEAVECGAAALAIILGYYGRFEQLPVLRVECGVSRDGSKASNVLKAARRYGLKAKGFSKGLKTLNAVQMPCVVFWEFNHFLVVEAMTDKWVYLNDPAVGHRKLTIEEFSEGFTGVVLTFSPGPDFVKKGSLVNPIPSILKRMRGSWKALGFVTLCGLLGVAPGIAQAAFTRVLLDNVITEGHFEWLRPLLVAMVLVLLFQIGLTALSGLLARRMQMGLAAKLHAEFLRHLLSLPYQFYAQRFTGEVVDRSRLNDSIVSLIAGQLTSTAIGLVTMVLFGIVLFSYNVTLTLIGVGSALLNFGLLRLVAKRRVEANIRIAKEMGKVQGATIAAISSIDSLKASGLEGSFYDRWAGYFTASSNAQLQLALESRWFSVLPTATNSLVSTATLLIGGFQVMEGQMTFGTLMAFNALMGMFLGPINSLLGLSIQMQQIRGNVIRLEDVLDHPTAAEQRADALHRRGEAVEVEPEVQEEADEERFLKTMYIARMSGGTRLEGQIECIDLTYGYSPLEAPLIENFNLRVEPGERVALVGGSGSGKSTVAKIVAGLMPAWSGEVRFDGKPPAAISRDVLNNSLAFIEQDILLFPGTVRENLTLWDDTIPESWLIEACQDAAILEDVLALPQGLDARLEENAGNLSGGQRQRLEIARTLVRNPSILIMDEATSALDAETEAIITEAIQRRGCTCLVVAHRLSTIKHCSKILVMSRGKIVESGTHEELWAAEGTYRRLLAHA